MTPFFSRAIQSILLYMNKKKKKKVEVESGAKRLDMDIDTNRWICSAALVLDRMDEKYNSLGV